MTETKEVLKQFDNLGDAQAWVTFASGCLADSEVRGLGDIAECAMIADEMLKEFKRRGGWPPMQSAAPAEETAAPGPDGTFTPET